MKLSKNLLGYIATLLLLVMTIACDNGGNSAVVTDPTAEESEPTLNIVETAVNAGSFTTLVAALEATGLDETLAGEGPFTVFAPTDDAFAKLPEGTVESLLADTETLSQILLYHVVTEELFAEDVLASDTLTTAQGDLLDVNLVDGAPFVNDSAIVTTDIQATNGVIHVIDTVLLP